MASTISIVTPERRRGLASQQPCGAEHSYGRQGSGADGNREHVSGFSLVETLIALFILTFGLLSAGQLIFLAMSSASLARSKGSGAIVAQNQLETLADLYRQDPSHASLTFGSHGPNVTSVNNPNDGSILNRYSISWDVAAVVTNGRTLSARQVTVTVTPIASTGATPQSKIGLNKIVNVTSIFSVRMP